MRDANIDARSEQADSEPMRIGQLLPQVLAQYAMDRRSECAEDLLGAYDSVGSYIALGAVDLIHA